MKKLLFVISQLYKGGAETALVNLLNKIDYSKHSVDLVILNQFPVKEAVSLVNYLNDNVNICNAYEEYQKRTVFSKLKAKMLYNAEQKQNYFFPALDFIRHKKYDWAFFWGEWCTPSFVALEVDAVMKATWIHTDISKAPSFNEEEYFGFYDKFDYFIFVSKQSMESSIEEYPFIQKKAITIYNISDVDYIKKRSTEKVDDLQKSNLPILLTCANFRPEKNHLRQIEVMAELKEKGLDFIWANIGSTSDKQLVKKALGLCEKYKIKDRFLILGPKENPYKYIHLADAVTVLSNYESWSMVITEGKILGKTVIATKTSGALEQIVDKESGLLADFNRESIANVIECFLRDKNVKLHIEEKVSNYDNTKEILDTFYQLIDMEGKENERDILYVIDDVNYVGGAHVATKLQINELVKNGRNVVVYSSFIPNVNTRKELQGVKFLSLRDAEIDILYKKRLFNCLLDKKLTRSEKQKKIGLTRKGYLKSLDYEQDVLCDISEEFSQYPVVCVMSEGSAYRSVVAQSKAIKKVQWIHTDYCAWREHSDWVKEITKNDEKIYKDFDHIVVLTQDIKERFCDEYPEFEKKVVVNQNLMPVSEIKQKASSICVMNENPLKFITVGRLGNEKEYPRLIEILTALKKVGYRFAWTIVGGGENFEYIKSLIQKNGLEKEVIMTGSLDNPFPKMLEADIFALLSSYEGLPNTIFEALILGIPVLATDVGGISTQIKNNETGWLVENTKDGIQEKLEFLLMHQNNVKEIKENLKDYLYDNASIMEVTNNLFMTKQRGDNRNYEKC